MSRLTHTIYIAMMVIIVLIVTIYLGFIGYDYFTLPVEERFYHPQYDWFKPSGVLGHGLGIAGTLMILFGVSIYIARKRYGFMERYLRLKYLLEFHIFLCSLGPVLIVYHTTFKFGGIVSIAFWSMVAVVLSGVVGRFIYIQIPRTIEGRELSLNEVKESHHLLLDELKRFENLDRSISDIFTQNSQKYGWGLGSYLRKRQKVNQVKKVLRASDVDATSFRKIMVMVRQEISLASRIERLTLMQKLFRYWHVVHMPFAIIMLVIVIIHVAVSLTFGYKWIF